MLSQRGSGGDTRGGLCAERWCRKTLSERSRAEGRGLAQVPQTPG